MPPNNTNKELENLIAKATKDHERFIGELRKLSELASKSLQEDAIKPSEEANVENCSQAKQARKINNSGYATQLSKLPTIISRLKSTAGRPEYKEAISNFRNAQKRGLSLDTLAKIRDETSIHTRETSRQIQALHQLFNTIDLGKNPFSLTDFIPGWHPRF